MFQDVDLRDAEIRLILTSTSEANPEKNHVPAYKFDIALISGEVIGKCDLRVGHNRNTYYGGNIGYEIQEPYRGHRYAAKACALLFSLAAMHKMDYVIITCDVSNQASSRTCLIAGGMFLEDVDIPKDNDMYQRGMRRVKVYKFLLHDMENLFNIDRKDYDVHGPILNRHSVRGIIIRDGKVAMISVKRYGTYKFPGGGSDSTESKIQTLVREVREESGLMVKPDTAVPFGFANRTQKDDKGNLYNQDNFFYLCLAEDEIGSQELMEDEAKDGYALEFISPEEAIAANRTSASYNDHFVGVSLERECQVLELLISKGYFK